MSSLARRVLTGLIALLLGSGVVAAVTQAGDDDRPSSADPAAISGEEGDGEPSTTTTSPVTTSTSLVPAPGASGVPAADSPRDGGGSGLAAEGAGEVAGGQQAMADTGAESLLGPGAVLTLTALALRRRLRLSSSG